ncbi:MAG: hypothetical protein WA151_11910, partial [Desulfatirhabdiaceae bacterium]
IRIGIAENTGFCILSQKDQYPFRIDQPPKPRLTELGDKAIWTIKIKTKLFLTYQDAGTENKRKNHKSLTQQAINEI